MAWDESKHPRGPGGRFAKKADVANELEARLGRMTGANATKAKALIAQLRAPTKRASRAKSAPKAEKAAAKPAANGKPKPTAAGRAKAKALTVDELDRRADESARLAADALRTGDEAAHAEHAANVEKLTEAAEKLRGKGNPESAASKVKPQKHFAGATDDAVSVHAEVQRIGEKHATGIAAAEKAVDDARSKLFEVKTGDKAGGQKAREAFKAAKANRDKAIEAGKAEARAAMMSAEPSSMGIKDETLDLPVTGGWREDAIGVNETVREGHAFFAGLVGKGSAMDGKEIGVSNTRRVERASAFGGHDTIGINTEKESAGVMVHELTHHVEYNDKAALKASLDFREKRRLESGDGPFGEAYRPLKQINAERSPNGQEYGDDNDAIGDKFFSPYCGKRYTGDGSTEILTMGAQKLYEDPIGFAKSDPEYFQFTLTTLQGNRRKT